MSVKVAEIKGILQPAGLASEVAYMWDNLNTNRNTWIKEKEELRNYIFATDTTKTSNSKLPWKNKTTIPKLCQIRDNLHANYASALFPNDNWFKWEGYSRDAVTLEKRKTIEAYVGNKIRMSGFRTEVYKLLYDFIDYGNVFWDVVFVNESHKDADGNIIQGYRGPKLKRISPYDVVFNPLASSFKDSYNIVRSVKTFGELKWELDNMPEMGYNKDVVGDMENYRRNLAGYSTEDLSKALALQVDGFGNYSDYLQSGYVEILEFEGSLHDKDTGKFHQNVLITVVDRAKVIRIVPMPSWMGKTTKGHVGWRMRPDNLYGMGPLDNLVGMQYRIDHLENLKADAMDLAVHPPLAITGNVEEFEWGPNAEIYIGEGGNIQELGKSLNGVIAANNEIAMLELKMEEMAGAPKQAMGIRTPGEKTAYEVQSLEQAASRIFQNKITHFEVECIEDILNKMFEVSKRNMDGADLVRVLDDDLGVLKFMEITKDDITASGKIRPMGARHFAAQATTIQNLTAFYQSAIGQDPSVRTHISGKAVAKLLEEYLGLDKFALFQDNVRVFEDAETMSLAQQSQKQLQEEYMVDPNLTADEEAAVLAQGQM
jgi:hypothetical protein